MAPSSKTPVYRHGLKVWRAPPSPNLDICFIHGLNGDRDETWTSKDEETPWPEQFLAQIFPHARLLTYGYDSDVLPSTTASTGTLRTIADGLVRSLKDNRETAQLQSLPIIFVAHSLGGLVCKRAMYRSFHNRDAKMKAIALCLLGIIFMGTPHTGSVYANLFSPLISGIAFFKSAGKPLLKALIKDSETATDLNEDFVGVIDLLDKNTNIFCFFEGKPKRGVKHLIVSRASATYSQWPSQMINSDHSNMVKFQSDEDPDFQLLCGVLREFISSERATTFSSLRPPAEACPIAFETPPPSSTHILAVQSPQPTASFSGNGHPSQDQHGQNLSHFTGSQFSRSDADQGSISDQNSVASQRNNPPIRPSTPPLLFDPTAPNTGHPHTLPMPSNAATTPAHTRPQPIFHLYFSQNRDFIGREHTLERLQSLFFSEGYNTVALSGLGGIGKSQVANAFAYRVKESRPGNSVIWLPVVSRAAFEEAYSAVAKKLSIQVDNKSDLLIEVRDYINQDTARPWFIIVDNADDPTLVCDNSPNSLDHYFPKGDHVRTLVTTRTKIVASTLADETIELVAFGPEHAVQMARRLLRQKWSLLASDESSVGKLLQELEFLPLAISQAMAYMRLADMPADEYLQLLRATDSSRVDLLGNELPDRNRYKESAHAVATTWLVSFERIQNTNPSAVTILEFLSQVLPKAVPLSMLPMIGSEADTSNAIMSLQEYNFVSRQGDLLDMHRLVHVAARSWIDKNGRSEEVNRLAFKHMSEIYPFSKYENQAVWSKYLPHGICMVDYKTAIASVEQTVMCLRLVQSFNEGSRSREAVRYGEKGHEFALRFLPEDDEERLDLEHALAIAYSENGQIQEAVQLLEHVVQIEGKTLAETHPSRLTSQHALAIAYQSNGQSQEAVQLLEHVVRIREKTLAETHPSRLASQHALAIAYRSNGQVQEAVQLLEHVVRIREKILAETHPNLLASQHALANAYESNGQIQKAVQLLEHVVQIEGKTLAETHPSRLSSQHALANAYESNGQIQKAVQLLEHVVQIEGKTLAETHPSRLSSQHALANAYESNGQIQKAVQLLEHVVQIEGKTLAETHLSRLTSQHTLATVYQSNGQIQEAMQLLEHVVQIHEKTLAETHPHRLTSLSVLASCLVDLGNVERAKEIMRHVVSVSQVSMPHHPDCKLYESILSSWEEAYPDA